VGASARLVRGVCAERARASFCERSARGFGATPGYLLKRHILPQAGYVLLIQAAVLIPNTCWLEVTLSFVGLGVAEPVPSWVICWPTCSNITFWFSYWWMYLPALAARPVSLGYFLLANSFQERAATSAALISERKFC